MNRTFALVSAFFLAVYSLSAQTIVDSVLYIVENATDEIRVYDVMGRLICRDVACRVRTEIPMEKYGIYIVKIGTLAKKLIIE